MTQSRTRSKILCHPRFAKLGSDVEEYVEAWIQSSSPLDLVGLLDEACTEIIQNSFDAVSGSEGTVWLSDNEEEHLVAVYNSGKDAENLVGFKQPIGSGIISLVYSQQQPYCENEIEGSDGHDDTLDKKMHKRTTAMIAVPFYFSFQLRGVISCVQLEDNSQSGNAPGFDSEQVTTIVKAANSVERFINANLLSMALGLDNG